MPFGKVEWADSLDRTETAPLTSVSYRITLLQADTEEEAGDGPEGFRQTSVAVTFDGQENHFLFEDKEAATALLGSEALRDNLTQALSREMDERFLNYARHGNFDISPGRTRLLQAWQALHQDLYGEAFPWDDLHPEEVPIAEALMSLFRDLAGSCFGWEEAE
jgi:hypothetical protein